MMGLDKRGVDKVTDLCNALNNGRPNNVIAGEVTNGLSRSLCGGTLESLARLVDLFSRGESILGILGKKVDRGTSVALFIGRL